MSLFMMVMIGKCRLHTPNDLSFPNNSFYTGDSASGKNNQGFIKKCCGEFLYKDKPNTIFIHFDTLINAKDGLVRSSTHLVDLALAAETWRVLSTCLHIKFPYTLASIVVCAYMAGHRGCAPAPGELLSLLSQKPMHLICNLAGSACSCYPRDLTVWCRALKVGMLHANAAHIRT